MEILTHKQCTECLKIKSTSEFHRESRTKDGYKTKCKKCRSSREKKWIDPEKVRNRAARWFLENKSRAIKRIMKWKRENRDKVRESERRSRERNPDKVTERNHKRLALKKSSGESFTAVEWKNLKRTYENFCLCCHRQEPEVKLEADHVIPLKLGGKSTINNIQPLCRSCNARKGGRYIDYR